MSTTRFQIDPTETFEHLRGAPIVEAVIHWRARAENKLDPAELNNQLREKLPDYPQVQNQQEWDVESQVGPEATAVRHKLGWHGCRMQTEDGLHVAQFTRNGFVFSRLTPYQDWEQFESEATRLWQIYCELTKPSEVQRLGVRFINRIPLAGSHEYASLLKVPPLGLEELHLPLAAFMHQNIYEIPGHPYKLKAILTVQPPNPPDWPGYWLILDTDAFTTRPIRLEENTERLSHLRWIKNKAFFSIVTEEAISQFRGGRP